MGQSSEPGNPGAWVLDWQTVPCIWARALWSFLAPLSLLLMCI